MSDQSRVVELRVVAFGSEFVGSLEADGQNDPNLIRMFQQVGLLDATGRTMRGNILLRYTPKHPGDKERDTPYELVLSQGGAERVIEHGKISKLEQHDFDRTILLCYASGVKALSWVFLCDRNPHIEVTLGKVSPNYPHEALIQGTVRVPRAPNSVMPPSAISLPKSDVPESRWTQKPLPVHEVKAAPLPKAPEPVVAAEKPKPVVNGNGSHEGNGKVVTSTTTVVQVVSEPKALVTVAPVGQPRKSEEEVKMLLGQCKVILAPVTEVIPFLPDLSSPKFSGQPRKNFEDSELIKLGNSIKTFGQKTAIEAVPVEGIPGKKWELIDGERRFKAIMLVGIPYVLIITHPRMTKKDQHLSALIQNFCRVGHTPLELSNALQEQVEAGESGTSLAEALGLKTAFVYKMLSLQRLHPDLKPLLDPPTPKAERIRINEGQELSRIKVEEQVRIWERAKRETRRKLVYLKIIELGKPHIMHPKKAEAKPSTLVRVIERCLGSLEGVIAELKTKTSDDWRIWHTASDYLGSAQVPEMARLAQCERDLIDLRAKMTKARADARRLAIAPSTLVDEAKVA